jgi:DnaK suppressor protein
MDKKAREKLYEECRKRLLKAKEDHLVTFNATKSSLLTPISGDDGDVANAIEEQDLTVSRREKLLTLLQEIEAALERLEDGTYGVCEETEEQIEKDRLLALPWTRLSLEGAVIREREQKQRTRRAG